jgi:hypothetical protein
MRDNIILSRDRGVLVIRCGSRGNRRFGVVNLHEGKLTPRQATEKFQGETYATANEARRVALAIKRPEKNVPAPVEAKKVAAPTPHPAPQSPRKSMFRSTKKKK